MDESELIYGDAFLRECPSIYHKTDVIKFRSPFMWRNKVVFPPQVGCSVLVTGHSDYDINDSDVEYFKPVIWWCTNKQTRYPNVISIPLGIQNPEWYIIPNEREVFIQLANSGKLPIKNLVYMNFDVSTFPIERQMVFDKFKDKSFVTNASRVDRLTYLNDLKSHTFTICPRGNGVETHRMWEALYMDCIPIVKKDIAMEEFYDMPICFIDSWDQVTEEFLMEFEKKLIKDTKKLKLSYWLNRIRSGNRIR